MADELLRSKHAFGSIEGVDSALQNGVIDEFDILFLKNADGKPFIGWIDKDGKPVILQEDNEVIRGDKLPESGESGKIYICGTDAYVWENGKFANLCKPTDVSALEAEIATKITSEEVKTMIKESAGPVVEIVEF